MSLQLEYEGAGQHVPPLFHTESFMPWGRRAEERSQSSLRGTPLWNEPGIDDLLITMAASRAGDWLESVDALQRLARKKPSAEIYALLAHAYFKLEDYLRAATYFEKATKLNPKDHEALYALGLTYYQLGKPDKAIKVIRRVVNIDRRNPTAHFFLGYLYRYLNCWKEAEESYLEAIQLKENFAPAYQYLALLYLEIGRSVESNPDAYFRRAIETFHTLLKFHPKAADAYCNIGYIYDRLGERERASESYQSAVEVVNDDLGELTQLGTTLLDAKHYREAREVFRRAIDKMGNDTNLQGVSRAMLLTCYGVACMGVYASREAQSDDADLLREAQESYQEALALDPNYIHARNNLGAVYYEQGRLDEAIEVFKSALKIDPGNGSARDNLRTLMEQQLEERLFGAGLIKEIKEPLTDLAPYHNRTLMTVRTKSLSEVVIEGRR